MYGFSLGTAPNTELSAKPRSLTPSKLILEAHFASAEAMVQDASALSMPSSYFTDLKIDNAEEIKKVTQPFMWIHGQADAFLRISTNGEVVYKNYHGTFGEAHRIDNAGHSDVPKVWGFTAYSEAIEKFILK